ncbi:MAG: hypothetical protein M3R13_06225 [Armatimonadota bacterium]|nr:hypothetical protein [Armatimonadota bacterium]
MTEEQRANLTPEQRERLAAAEANALEMLNRKMREDRWFPRRHQRFVVFVIIGSMVLFLLVALIMFALDLLLS